MMPMTIPNNITIELRYDWNECDDVSSKYLESLFRLESDISQNEDGCSSGLSLTYPGSPECLNVKHLCYRSDSRQSIGAVLIGTCERVWLP